MAEKEEKRKQEYEQKNKTYRGNKEGSNKSYPSLAGYPDSESGENEEERKAQNEKMKKKIREQAQEGVEEKAKDKAAEAAGATFGLPPFLSRFIADHPVLVTVIVVGVILSFVVLVTALIVTITQHPFKFGLEMAKSIFKASWNLFRGVALPEGIQ